MNIELQITLWITAGWLLCGFIAYGLNVAGFLAIWEDRDGGISDYGQRCMREHRNIATWVCLIGGPFSLIAELLMLNLSQRGGWWRL